MSEEPELKSTLKGRKLRLENLLNFIKQQKKLTIAEIYTYMMKIFYLSKPVINHYITDLESMGQIKIEKENESFPVSEATSVEYKGGAEDE